MLLSDFVDLLEVLVGEEPTAANDSTEVPDALSPSAVDAGARGDDGTTEDY
jgi:hypothetical protein